MRLGEGLSPLSLTREAATTRPRSFTLHVCFTRTRSTTFELYLKRRSNLDVCRISCPVCTPVIHLVAGHGVTVDGLSCGTGARNSAEVQRCAMSSTRERL